MGNGTQTILEIIPHDLDPLVIDMSVSDTSTPYIGVAGSLLLHEEKRLQMQYQQGPPGMGGGVTSSFAPLVPIDLLIIIKADSRQDMFSAYNALQKACERGGMIRLRPEYVDAGAEDTYYHYVPSSPPKVRSGKGNRWDAAPKSDKKHTLYVEVRLMTQPLATSDPDNLTALVSSVTLDNDSGNYVDILAGDLRGTGAALLKIGVAPASSQDLGRVILFRRSVKSGEGFVNLVCRYEAESGEASDAWGQVTDASRYGSAYMRLSPLPGSTGSTHKIRFTINNPESHKGRFAVFGVCYDNSGESGAWAHRVELVVGETVVQSGKQYNAGHFFTWNLLYCGEFELPPTELNDNAGYGESVYLDWHAQKVSGGGAFNLDALLVVFVGDSDAGQALDLFSGTDRGVSAGETLVAERFYKRGEPKEAVFVAASGGFARVPDIVPRGQFITLDPTRDHRLFMLQERWTGVIFKDDFEGYEGICYVLIDGLDEGWAFWEPTGNTAEHQTGYYAEGFGGILLKGDEASATLEEGSKFSDYAPNWNLDRGFGDGDFFCIVSHIDTPNTCGFSLVAIQESGTDYYTQTKTPGSVWGFNLLKKSAFSVVGSPSWEKIRKIGLYMEANGYSNELHLDALRLEKADPDDSSVSNATGKIWDFQPAGGAWTITKDVSGADATLACLDTESDVIKAAWVHETLGATRFRYRARVMAKRDEGMIGLHWHGDFSGSGNEEGYAALISIQHNSIYVREYSAGAFTSKDSMVSSFEVDTWYVVGVVAEGSTYSIYVAPASDLSQDDDVYSYEYKYIEFADATFSSGKVGVLSISTLGRFDKVKAEALTNRVQVNDDITVDVNALFRAMVPFGE